LSLLNSEGVEQRLIGSLLRTPDAIHEIRDSLTIQMFANEACAEVYRVICDLAYEGVPLDRAVICRRASVAPEEAPLPVFLARLQSDVQYPADAEKYAREIMDAAMRREARKMFDQAMRDLESVPDARAVLQSQHSGILNLLGARARGGSGELGLIASKYLSDIRQTDTTSYVTTGIHFVDDIIGPMQPGNLIVLGGSTSAGKTALAEQIGLSVAERGNPVLYISLEMEKAELGARAVSRFSDVSVADIEMDQLNMQDEQNIMRAAENLQGVPIYIEDLPRATVAGVTALVMKYKKLFNIRLVIVDHLHYLRSSNRKLGRFEAIEEIVMDMKADAKQTQIPWLAISHLSRDIAKRPDKRPLLIDLYGASEIEKSADVVFFVHREQYWLERDKPKGSDLTFQAWEDAYARAQGRAEIIVAKRRRGKGAASRMCAFDEKTTKFYAL
jgi:replicative DNA helicase